MASRMVGRETSKSVIRLASDGSLSPGFKSPRTMALRSRPATSSAVLGMRIWPAEIESNIPCPMNSALEI